MLRGSFILFPALALLVPATTFGLGLGELHVTSDLNQPLAAQIEIVNASADELLALNASIANREMFQRYNAERPAFLSTTTFKVTKNRDGHPILAIRSDAPFTEPLVSLLVDLRWPHGELVREYTLLLDPAEMGYAVRLHQTTPELVTDTVATVANTTTTRNATTSTNATATPPRNALDAASSVASGSSVGGRPSDYVTASTGHRQVIANGSLRRVARRAGVRSKSDLHRMMVAIYRANPSAFDGNMNRMHRRVLLTIPTAAELATISRAEANREFAAQRASWRASSVAAGVSMTAPVAANSTAAQTTDSRPAETARTADPGSATLNRRVQALEQSLDELKRLLSVEHGKVAEMQQVAQTPAPAVRQGQSIFVPVAAGLGFLIGLLVALRFRRPKAGGRPAALEAPAALPQHLAASVAAGVPTATPDTRKPPVTPPIVASTKPPVPAAAKPSATPASPPSVTAESARPPLPAGSATTAVVKSEVEGESSVVATGDTTSVLAIETTAVLPVDKIPTLEDLEDLVYDETYIGIENVKLDYNLIDLDTTAQHVHLPSVLHDHVIVDETRTNIVDVLVMAIERDPHRRDLRLKLLEVYFSSGVPSRAEFLDVARKLAKERDHLSPGDWEKVVIMGRQLAPDDELFAPPAEELRRAG